MTPRTRTIALVAAAAAALALAVPLTASKGPEWREADLLVSSMTLDEPVAALSADGRTLHVDYLTGAACPSRPVSLDQPSGTAIEVRFEQQQPGWPGGSCPLAAVTSGIDIALPSAATPGETAVTITGLGAEPTMLRI